MQAINKERVAGLLQGLAQFGKTEHGINKIGLYGRRQSSAGMAAQADTGLTAEAVCRCCW